MDGGIWYEKKTKAVVELLMKKAGEVSSGASSATSSESVSLRRPAVLPITCWKAFPAYDIPHGFCYGSIYKYFNESQLTYVDEDANVTHHETGASITAKPLQKGRIYFESGHVGRETMHSNFKDNFYYIKASVKASYTDVLYPVTVTINQEGYVQDATCDCVASAMARCNHIAGLLFALEDYTVRFGYSPAPCTSLLATWNRGKKSGHNPLPAHAATYNKKRRSDRVITFDPLLEPSSSDEFISCFITTLPSTNVFSMWETAAELKYDDYEIESLDMDVLRERIRIFMNNLSSVSSNVDGPHCVSGTEDQAGSDTWFNERRSRITASDCKRVQSLKNRRSAYTFLQNKIYDKVVSTKSMTYGQEHEADALDLYRQLNPNLTVCRTGLWLNSKYPGLGCSPDGLIQCDDEPGLIEIKCPAILKGCSPINIKSVLTKSQLSAFCCYSNEDGSLQLKAHHKYNYQVQMQMAICERKFTDFIVWSPCGVSVERVHFDNELWQIMCPKLLNFHINVLVPELLEMRVPRRLLPFWLNNS